MPIQKMTPVNYKKIFFLANKIGRIEGNLQTTKVLLKAAELKLARKKLEYEHHIKPKVEDRMSQLTVLTEAHIEQSQELKDTSNYGDTQLTVQYSKNKFLLLAKNTIMEIEKDIVSYKDQLQDLTKQLDEKQQELNKLMASPWPLKKLNEIPSLPPNKKEHKKSWIEKNTQKNPQKLLIWYCGTGKTAKKKEKQLALGFVKNQGIRVLLIDGVGTSNNTKDEYRLLGKNIKRSYYNKFKQSISRVSQAIKGGYSETSQTTQLFKISQMLEQEQERLREVDKSNETEEEKDKRAYALWYEQQLEEEKNEPVALQEKRWKKESEENKNEREIKYWTEKEYEFDITVGGHSRGATGGVTGYISQIYALIKAGIPLHGINSISIIAADPVEGHLTNNDWGGLRDYTKSRISRISENDTIHDLITNINKKNPDLIKNVSVVLARYDPRTKYFTIDQNWQDYMKNHLDLLNIYHVGFRHSTMINKSPELLNAIIQESLGLITREEKDLIVNKIEKKELSLLSEINECINKNTTETLSYESKELLRFASGKELKGFQRKILAIGGALKMLIKKGKKALRKNQLKTGRSLYGSHTLKKDLHEKEMTAPRSNSLLKKNNTNNNKRTFQKEKNEILLQNRLSIPKLATGHVKTLINHFNHLKHPSESDITNTRMQENSNKRRLSQPNPDIVKKGIEIFGGGFSKLKTSKKPPLTSAEKSKNKGFEGAVN